MLGIKGRLSGCINLSGYGRPYSIRCKEKNFGNIAGIIWLWGIRPRASGLRKESGFGFWIPVVVSAEEICGEILLGFGWGDLVRPRDSGGGVCAGAGAVRFGVVGGFPRWRDCSSCSSRRG